MLNKFLSLLGICYRAKGLVFGETILKEFSKSKIKLVIIANDASEKTKQRFTYKCQYYHLPVLSNINSADLSFALGKNNIKTIGIVDDGFAKKLLELGGQI